MCVGYEIQVSWAFESALLIFCFVSSSGGRSSVEWFILNNDLGIVGESVGGMTGERQESAGATAVAHVLLIDSLGLLTGLHCWMRGLGPLRWDGTGVWNCQMPLEMFENPKNLWNVSPLAVARNVSSGKRREVEKAATNVVMLTLESLWESWESLGNGANVVGDWR